ncbi:MAG: polysaccharide pyruvyl transferase family protein [Thermoanaerobaculia bacterium]
MRRTALLVGYYGFGNTGDEAILAALASGIARLQPTARLLVVSGDPEDSRRRHGLEAVGWLDPAAIADAVKQSDLVVVGGGGLFQDYWGVDPGTLLTSRHWGISFYAGPAILAALARKPFALHGLGFGPLASSEARRLTRAVSEAASSLSVRDEASRRLLIEAGVPEASLRLSADPAFLLDVEPQRPDRILGEAGIAPRAPVAAVALREWSLDADPASWEREMAAGLDLFLEQTGGTLVFVPLQHGSRSVEDDVAVAARLRSSLRNAERALLLTEVRPAAETASLLSGCDVVVGMRLHALVFAASGGAPPVGVAYDPKVSLLLERLGCADFGLPLRNLNSSNLLDRMMRALDAGAERLLRIREAAGRLRALAQADLGHLASLLEHPPAAPPPTHGMLELFDDALRANLVLAQGSGRELETLRAGEAALRKRAFEAETRIAPAQAQAAAAERRLNAAEKAHRNEKSLLERQLAETRQELHGIHTSLLWKLANPYWAARRKLSGLLSGVTGRPPSDWAGPNEAQAPRKATAVESDNRHEIVFFPIQDREPLPPLLQRYARAGHRVFRVSPTPRADGAPYALAERSPGAFEVSLRGASDTELFEALDALRRDRGLGAAVSIVQQPSRAPIAERLRRERAWPMVYALLESPEARGDDALLESADFVLTDSPGLEEEARRHHNRVLRYLPASEDLERSFRAVSDAFPRLFPKVSIVIVTYNNVDLNRLCLESVFARTEWPCFEVLVVDNGSNDGTPELLREMQRARPDLTVLQNETNQGFAAACNRGLEAASGNFLVLLNNDTVVTRGWLTALVRHLRANPGIGMIGPVTNAVSNEAKVEVGYSDVRGLPAWAADWVREHDLKSFAIPMLAFFCVAMHRQTWEAVGPLDERFGLGMFEDDDYNRRARSQGWEIRCAQDAFVHHWQKASFRLLGKDAYLALFEQNRKKYEEKWGESWKAEGVDVWQRADLGFFRDQLASVRDRVRNAPGVVLFLPSIGWGIHLVQRPHHLARAFAKRGWVSIFDCSNAQDKINGFKEIEPNLFLFKGPPELLGEIPSPLLWTFPYNYAQVDAYPKPARVLYDWIDDLSVFPYERALLERNHERAFNEATLVASVARRLHTQALVRRPDALLLSNGVEYERFAAEAPPSVEDRDVAELRASGRPIAGYYGALAAWFDYDLLDAVAALRPDWCFLLIGPMYDKSLQGRPMLKRENVRWIGPRDYHLLPGYLALFDVATIPFQINDITTATSPLKLYEYFAGGKPVVTTPMPECQAYPEVAIARDAAEFAAALDRARERGKDAAFRERLRALARANTWDARIGIVLAALEEKTAEPHAHAER